MQNRGEERSIKAMKLGRAIARGDRTNIRQLADEVHKQKKQVEQRIITEAYSEEVTVVFNSGKEEDKEEDDTPRAHGRGEPPEDATQTKPRPNRTTAYLR